MDFYISSVFLVSYRSTPRHPIPFAAIALLTSPYLLLFHIWKKE